MAEVANLMVNTALEVQHMVALEWPDSQVKSLADAMTILRQSGALAPNHMQNLRRVNEAGTTSILFLTKLPSYYFCLMV